MAETSEPRWYCLSCGAENPVAALTCRSCARSLAASAQQEQQGSAFLLNELLHLNKTGEISDELYFRLTQRYREALNEALNPPEEVPAPDAAPSAEEKAASVRAKPAPARREGPSWVAEQQANFLLYVGAFLIVIASLVFVSTSGESIGDNVRMAMLVLGTLLFLAAGFFCLRIPRVEQAGVVFFAVGSLMVPITFVGAYGLYLSEDDIDPTGLWLAGSLTSAIFYGAVSFLGVGRWYPAPMVIALLSGLGATLALADAPPEAYPGSYIAMAFQLAAPSVLPYRHMRETFGPVCLASAHIVVPPAVLVALVMTGAAGDDWDFELTTRWYLPLTAALAALFYWAQAIWARRSFPQGEPAITIAALAVTAGAAVTIVFAMGVGEQWYGVAVAIIGWVYAAAGERSRLRWFGQRYVDWMAVGAITISWVVFTELYGDAPRIGAGVHFSAAAFYMLAARLVSTDQFQVPAGLVAGKERGAYQVPLAAGFIYAAGLVLGVGYFYLLSSLPAAETADSASDLALPFFGLSLGLAAVAATMRWWWPEFRSHVYAIAAGMSLFVLLSAVDGEGQVTVLLAAYTAVSLALTLWEREPLTLALPAAYGFFALLAAWRYYEPTDLYLPLAVAGVGCGLFALYAGLRNREAEWSRVVQALAFAYLVAAPIAGWVRLSILADPDGFIGTDSFEATALYQTSAAAVLLLGAFVAVQGWLLNRMEIVAVASTLLMVALLLEIGHFRPDNMQAYTAPLGVYLLAGASFALRLRTLPTGLRPLVEPVQALGAAVLMAPSLEQSWEDGGWPYALLLLGEGLFVLGLALVQRWLWLLAAATGFIVLDALRYLFNTAQLLPNWAILALAGTLVMAAGVAILLGRERWTVWQRTVQAWWMREPPPATPPCDRVSARS